MKTIENSKDITTLEVDDRIIFGNLRYRVAEWESVCNNNTYFLYLINNDKESSEAIFKALNLDKKDFIQHLGIDAYFRGDFPEVKSLEVLTVIVSALFKEYEKQNALPKTWEEFCKRNPVKKEECWIECFNGKILRLVDLGSKGTYRDAQMDKHLCTSKQEAEAFLAFMQLRQLRKAYVKDWEPNWDGIHDNYSIIVCQQKLVLRTRSFVSHTLSFPTYELANQFLTNFKDLLEIAKPLL